MCITTCIAFSETVPPDTRDDVTEGVVTIKSHVTVRNWVEPSACLSSPRVVTRFTISRRGNYHLLYNCFKIYITTNDLDTKLWSYF